MKKIQDENAGYSLLKRITISLFRLFYGEITVLGEENLTEEDRPVIFAPTHQNALMDALSVHACYRYPIVFMMRSDAFANPKPASFLKFIKIMPIFRMQEGYDSLGKNEKYFEWAIDTLNDGKALGIMPEGNQREQRRLRPLKKGLFRIGFKAQENNPNVQVIPVGVDYEDYDRAGKHLLINIGKPLEFSDYFMEYQNNPPKGLNKMRDALYSEMRKLIVHIDDEKNYERYYLALLIAINEQKENGLTGKSAEEQFLIRKAFADRFPSAGEALPDDLKPFVEKADSCLKADPNPDLAFVISQPIKKQEIILSLLYSVFLLPSILLNGLPYLFIWRFTRKNFSHNGFIASASFIGGFIFYPIYWLLLFFLFAFILTPLKSLLLFLMTAPLLALVSLRIKSVYEDLWMKIRFKRRKK